MLSELLLLELQYASQDGRTLSPQLYTAQFPEHVEVVEEVFERWSLARVGETQQTHESTLVMRSQYARLQLHAEGGLGLVYRAGDRELGRNVALKFIRSTLADDSACRTRFRMEAEITGCLEHPGVVPVYGIGDAEGGRPFYAMRFIEGETLDEAIKRFHEEKANQSRTQREFEFRELLGRFVAVCKTVAYAHNRCIVHRDIKPENVMLGRYGETIVIDWGLAIPVNREGVFRQSGENTLLPGSGSNASGTGAGVAGTPGYMSPEQASGTADLTPSTDIFSLGVTLYKIMVGQRPFSGKLNQVLADTQAGKFPTPGAIDAHVPKALESICLKAMAVQPSDRYATALDLADDVERFLADAPVSAHREPVSTKLARWGRRHRVLSQTILAALLLFTVAASLAATVLGRLKSEAVALQKSEHQLLEHSLSMSARFAARTMANKVDVRLRMLEKEAADPELRRLTDAINAAPSDQGLRERIQSWIDGMAQRHSQVESRTLFVCSADGTQVARYPRELDDGSVSNTLGKNFAYRDYFHGDGTDEVAGTIKAPLHESKFSVAMESKSHDRDLIIALSTPVFSLGGSEDRPDPVGVLVMTVHLGRFADLKVPFLERQKVLLVDTRQYFMARAQGKLKQTGEGLVLHPFDANGGAAASLGLPTIDKTTIATLRMARERMSGPDFADVADNLMGDHYRDPLAGEDEGPWIAAFAPVLLSSRHPDSKAHDTGCFVIVQQQSQR